MSTPEQQDEQIKINEFKLNKLMLGLNFEWNPIANFWQSNGDVVEQTDAIKAVREFLA